MWAVPCPVPVQELGWETFACLLASTCCAPLPAPCCLPTAQFIRCNLVPSTLGNLLGGSILVASAYACSLGSPGHALQVGQRGGLSLHCTPDG